MARQFTDDENNLKRRARRRLVGAVALATAVVVLLPMLLDSEPKQVAQDIELQIPDKDKVPELEATMLEPPTSSDTPATSSIAGTHTNTASAVAAPVVAGTSSPAAAMPLPAKAAEKPASFVVQIGAYSNAASAHQLQKKLSKQGIKTYTEKADDKTRVRAGPYATREAANKVLQKLEKQELKPVINQIQ